MATYQVTTADGATYQVETSDSPGTAQTPADPSLWDRLKQSIPLLNSTDSFNAVTPAEWQAHNAALRNRQAYNAGKSFGPPTSVAPGPDPNATRPMSSVYADMAEAGATAAAPLAIPALAAAPAATIAGMVGGGMTGAAGRKLAGMTGADEGTQRLVGLGSGLLGGALSGGTFESPKARGFAGGAVEAMPGAFKGAAVPAGAAYLTRGTALAPVAEGAAALTAVPPIIKGGMAGAKGKPWLGPGMRKLFPQEVPPPPDYSGYNPSTPGLSNVPMNGPRPLTPDEVAFAQAHEANYTGPQPVPSPYVAPPPETVPPPISGRKSTPGLSNVKTYSGRPLTPDEIEFNRQHEANYQPRPITPPPPGLLADKPPVPVQPAPVEQPAPPSLDDIAAGYGKKFNKLTPQQQAGVLAMHDRIVNGLPPEPPAPAPVAAAPAAQPGLLDQPGGEGLLADKTTADATDTGDVKMRSTKLDRPNNPSATRGETNTVNKIANAVAFLKSPEGRAAFPDLEEIKTDQQLLDLYGDVHAYGTKIGSKTLPGPRGYRTADVNGDTWQEIKDKVGINPE